MHAEDIAGSRLETTLRWLVLDAWEMVSGSIALLVE